MSHKQSGTHCMHMTSSQVQIYRRFSIHSCYNLSLITPISMVEHWWLKGVFILTWYFKGGEKFKVQGSLLVIFHWLSSSFPGYFAQRACIFWKWIDYMINLMVPVFLIDPIGIIWVIMMIFQCFEFGQLHCPTTALSSR